MTRREIELARNENEQTFRKLSPEAQAAVRKAVAEGVEDVIGYNGTKYRCNRDEKCWDGVVYLIAPNVNHEDETPEGCEDVDVYKGKVEYVFWSPHDGEEVTAAVAPGFLRFVAIGYELEGTITLRTSVDAAFGVPKFVRFRK